MLAVLYKQAERARVGSCYVGFGSGGRRLGRRRPHLTDLAYNVDELLM